MAIPDSVKYLIEALRTSPSPASTTINSGPRAGTTITPNPSLGPIEQRRDGYRLYRNEKIANGEQPMSYEDWFAKDTGQ